VPPARLPSACGGPTLSQSRRPPGEQRRRTGQPGRRRWGPRRRAGWSSPPPA